VAVMDMVRMSTSASVSITTIPADITAAGAAATASGQVVATTGIIMTIMVMAADRIRIAPHHRDDRHRRFRHVGIRVAEAAGTAGRITNLKR
jgi:hypothetical protein